LRCLEREFLNLSLQLGRTIQCRHLADSPERLHGRVLHDLRPVPDQEDLDGRENDDDEERPVEPAAVGGAGQVEAEHDEDDEAGDDVDQHLEPQKVVDLLPDIVEVAVDAAEDVKLEDERVFLG